MKDFLIKTIQGLWASAGYDQVKELRERGGQKAVEQIIDVLVIECTKFPKIPDIKKQELIERGIQNEEYFRGLNAKLLNKWFYAYGISKQGQSVQAGDPPGFAKEQEERELASIARHEQTLKENPGWTVANAIKDYQDRIKLMMNRAKKQPSRERYYDNGTKDVEYIETK